MPGSRALKDTLLDEENENDERVPTILDEGVRIKLTEEQEEEIIEIVRQDFKAAEDARNNKDWGGSLGDQMNWEEFMSSLIRLYENISPPRKEKWQSPGSLRIAMTIVETMFARLFPAIWNEDSIRWMPTEATDKDRVDRIERFMKWAVNAQMKIRRVLKPAVKSTIKLGNAILKHKWVAKRENRGETETILVVDEQQQPIVDPQTGQQAETQQPKLSLNEKPEVELVKLEDFYVQPGQTDLQKEPIIHRQRFFFEDLETMEMNGQAKNVSNLVKDKLDKLIVSDLQQTINTAQNLSEMNTRRRRHGMDVLEWYGPYDPIIDAEGKKVGMPAECVFLIDMTTWTYLDGMYLSTISKKNKRPFNKLGFILREHAFYWIGVLEQIKPLAIELDAAFRQMIDANTISIMRFGFYDPAGDYEPETHTIKPRAMYPVSNPRENVFFPDISIDIGRLISAIRMVVEFIERLTASSELTLGTDPGVGGGSGTATKTQAIVAASNERLGMPAENMREGIADVLSDVLCLYQMNIPPGLEKRVLGEKGEPLFKAGELTKASIAAELDAYLLPSASFGSRQVELEISNWVYQNLLGNPLVAPSIERIWNVTAKPLRAMGLNPEEFIGAEPESNRNPIDPEDENTKFRQGEGLRPQPQENHVLHLLKHRNATQDPDFFMWKEEAKALLLSHIQETEQMFQQVLQLIAQQQKGAKPGGPGNEPGATGGAANQPQTTSQGPGKGLSGSGVPNPLANQAKGVAGTT